MRDDHFEWDDAKAASNLAKHKVSFALARLVFDDPHSIDEPDADPDEDRWQCLGMAANFVLLVVYVERGVRTRIISARPATSHEQDKYRAQFR
jgi:uncharacterized protein